MPQPLTPFVNTNNPKPEGNRLTIRNYGKIRGLCHYDDGVWEPLHATHIKSGGRAYIEWIEESDESYRLRLLYIKPQPDAAIITVWRNGQVKVGKRMWRVEMVKGNEKVKDEWWESEEFGMKRLLESIKIWLIDK